MYQSFPIENIYRPTAWSDMILRIFEEAENDGGDVFECMRTLQKIRPGNSGDWYNEWTQIANDTEKIAKESLQKGHDATARRAFLRAYNYYRIAQFYLNVGDEKKRETYKKAIQSFREAAPLFSPPLEYIEVPYEEGKLDGILYRTSAKEKKGLVIYIQGLDTQKEEAYFLGGKAALERGFDLLSIEGPGQGAALFLRGMAGTHEFEKPVSAFIDAASKIEGVRSDKVAIVGRSMGGYFAPRAAAFEKRVKACVAWGALYNLELQSKNPTVNMMALLGAKDKEDFRRIAQAWSLKDVVDKISCPLLILHGEADPMEDVAQAYQMYEEAVCDKKLEVFKLGEPGAGHCQHDSPATVFPLIFDWLQEKLS